MEHEKAEQRTNYDRNFLSVHRHLNSNIEHAVLPVVIDMACGFVFIQSDTRLFILHRIEERLGLALAHLTFLLGFGLGRLRGLIRRLFRFLACSSFQFTGEFLLGRF